MEIDVYRDFDAEEDETISIRLGEVQGNGERGATARVQLNILDGGPAGVDKMPELPGPGGPDAALFPSHFIITEGSIDFGAIVAGSPFETASPGRLIAEYSSDLNFSSDVYSLGVVDIPPFDPGFQFFPEPHVFSLPLSRLLPNESYYIRMYLLNEPPQQPDIGDPFGSAFMFSFATDAQGSVTTRCEAPVRSPAAAPGDPLFDRQWHLQNTGQSAFAENPGTPGADLQMAAAIAQGRDGDGVKLAIPDNDGAGVTHSLDVIDLPNTANLEAVVTEIRVDHLDTWDLGIELTSPSGTVSVLNAPFNSVLSGFSGLRDWQLMSNAFYGESPNGTWTVRVVDLPENDVGRLSAWRLRFYYGDHP